ncbi:MAG: hypothetical protein AMXMBFR77_21540 [Phycisphaerales bacterium]|nr:hypothetical protein [Leptolyngbya sp.]MCZ7632387.1 hypothetical protein [Phycisphaerales bacterium]MDL1903586.1 hypothetical protein [Synechococcales cyanobacterium CNB]GIK20057.1 MAG: hypothetical protein BroJett004_22210 [Planctomycetota bacterium]
MGYGRQIAALVVACGLGSAAAAQVSDPVGPAPGTVSVARPDVLVYEGLLVYLGTPVEGEVDMVVTAWDRPLGGALLEGPTEYTAVLVEDGWFRVELEPTLLERGRGFAWLEVSVRWPSGLGEYERLDGRQRVDFGSVVYVPNDGEGGAARGGEPDDDGARFGARGRTATPISTGRGLAAGDRPDDVRDPARGRFDGSSGTIGDGSEGGGGTRACDWTIVGDNVYYECGNVGVGTTNPLHRLHVVSGGQHAIFSVNTLNTGGLAYGVWGQAASTSGRGVVGFATAGTGATAGLYGRSDSTAGRGVFGVATAPSGFVYGVWGEAGSPTGRGVLGFATSATGGAAGLFGRSDSTTGYGLFSLATAVSGQNYAVFAETMSSGGFAGYFKGGKNYFQGRVGIGTESPEGALHVLTGVQHGVFSQASHNTGRAVYGEATGSNNGIGVIGVASATTGTNYGMYGRTHGSTGTGVYGIAMHTTGTTYGVQGRNHSSAGRGVYGYATSGSGTTYGVMGEAESTSGRGVFGRALSGSGTTYGVRGEVSSTSGRGVYGSSSATTGTTYGVYGTSSSSSGRGVFGFSNNSTSTARGVLGQAAAPAVAVYAVGNSHASGTKTFEIDHPLDPANKYLRHYSTEAPEPINFYSGNVVLDDAGQAWVDLPDYFEEINRDFRYQLTTIGGWAPVYVALEIEDNRFMIAGGPGGMKVSWRVEAIRNDAYVRVYGAPVEVEKAESERGKFIHPELFGQPEEMGIYYDPEPIGPTPVDEVPADLASGS